jgi:hypothetical protein
VCSARWSESSQDLGTVLFECGMWTQESVCESSKAMVG